MRVDRIIAIVLILSLAACSSEKRLARQAEANAIYEDLDSVEIVVSRENPYRGSATRDMDLLHTRLEVTPDYAEQWLYGKATLKLRPYFMPASTLVIDAKSMQINTVALVKADKTQVSLTYTYDSVQLKIKLDREYTSSETFSIFIDYIAKPNERVVGGSAAISEDRGLYFINPYGREKDKPTQVWTQGETEAASCWFPTIDKPNEKCTSDIFITHDKKYVSLSNGIMVSSTPNKDSSVTDYWKMDLPHSPYLFMMVIGDFSIIKNRWREIEVNYYVEKEYAPYAQQIFGNTPEMMEYFSQKLGFDYPWQKYSQISVRDYVSGAMENTTATLHTELLQRTSRELLDETYEDYVSHELFHQWFGDLVTCESWSNTPLNESFATYGEWLWNEYKYGKEYADYKNYGNYKGYMGESEKGKNVDLIRFYYEDREDMFDKHSYDKGGYLLRYLQTIVGDDAFFKSLELYLKTNQFKPVEIHNLRLAFEEVTGRDMNWFFNQWFLNSGHPVLDIKYNYTTDSVFVTINQRQNTDKGLVYQLPFKLNVHYGKNIDKHQEILTKRNQTFGYKAYGTPSLIDFDGERVVLCQKTENKTVDNYVFQYNNSGNYVAKMEALEKLAEEQKKSDPARYALQSALNDKFFDVRRYAIEQIRISEANKETVLPEIEILARGDKYSKVREAAIKKLDFQRDNKFLPVFEAALSDSSYIVAAAALRAISNLDATKALEKTKLFEGDMNININDAVADVYATKADQSYQAAFEDKVHKSIPSNKYLLMYYYANFLCRMDDKNTVLKGLDFLYNESEPSESRTLTSAGKGTVKRVMDYYERKRKIDDKQLSIADKAEQLEIQERINNYDVIISKAKEHYDDLVIKMREFK
jgi:aminopeptidase N